MSGTKPERPADATTASRFASSWNNVAPGSVYSSEQFLEWFQPLGPEAFRNARVLEMGFGNGSLLVHAATLEPAKLVGIELGDTQEVARANLAGFPPERLELHQGDLTSAELGEFDLAYCIGVLHHLQEPASGFEAVLRHVRPGGRFHCWVYGHEGNAVVRWLVEPIRRVASRLPWWFTKWGLALPLVLPYFVYAKALRALSGDGRRRGLFGRLPLFDYSLWIAKRDLRFFHHVAFDQLVTPRTVYLRRAILEAWLDRPEILPESRYIRFRNGNSWVFGGTRA